jgi:hypothetical protein
MIAVMLTASELPGFMEPSESSLIFDDFREIGLRFDKNQFGEVQVLQRDDWYWQRGVDDKILTCLFSCPSCQQEKWLNIDHSASLIYPYTISTTKSIGVGKFKKTWQQETRVKKTLVVVNTLSFKYCLNCKTDLMLVLANPNVSGVPKRFDWAEASLTPDKGRLFVAGKGTPVWAEVYVTIRKYFPSIDLDFTANSILMDVGREGKLLKGFNRLFTQSYIEDFEARQIQPVTV